MANKLLCKRVVYVFDDGTEVVWYPLDKSKPNGPCNVSIKIKVKTGGVSWSTGYTGPASIHQSLHLIKMAKKKIK